MNHPPCPVCKRNDSIKFVFVEHELRGNTSSENPSDETYVFMCPFRHIFDAEGKQIVPLENEIKQFVVETVGQLIKNQNKRN